MLITDVQAALDRDAGDVKMDLLDLLRAGQSSGSQPAQKETYGTLENVLCRQESWKRVDN